MSKREKLRRKLRNNPKGVKFSEVETLLIRFGFTLIRIKGSHHVFLDAINQVTVVVPVHGNIVKSQYVRDVVEIIDRLFPETAQSDEETSEGATNEQDD